MCNIYLGGPAGGEPDQIGGRACVQCGADAPANGALAGAPIAPGESPDRGDYLRTLTIKGGLKGENAESADGRKGLDRRHRNS